MVLRILSVLLLALSWLVAAPTFAEGVSGYRLRPEWQGRCKRSRVIDVNLGNTPDAFVTAASCQVSGLSIYPEHQNYLVTALKNNTMRRIDIVRNLCAGARRKCSLTYSSPWLDTPPLEPSLCDKRYQRDIGAVLMFFFHCPGGANCAMDWAGNHVAGMAMRDDDLGGFYTPDIPGFWRHELRAAKAAGLQFVLPNLYGPDMQAGQIDALAVALRTETDSVKIGLFDDTWAWGHAKSGAPWSLAPDLADTDRSAKILYESKWKPYFSKVSPEYWYRISGRPVIYFYNAGTLKPANKAATVLARMKALFTADFGVTPFVVVDDAFFADPGMASVADSRFRWDTLAGDFHARDDTVTVTDRLSRSAMSGRVMTNAFVRWDSHNRDHLGKAGSYVSPFDDRAILGDDLLQSVLDRTRDADSLLLQTWNDLGEGTGVTLAYDYYDHGSWLPPDHFIRQIRAANCNN